VARRYLLFATVVIWGLALVAEAGCSGDALPPAAASSSPIVARVAGVPIYAQDVAQQMRRTGGNRRRALDDLVTFELLARAAAATTDPHEVDHTDVEAQRAAKVQRLLEREIEPRTTRAAIDDAEVRALYERAKTRFVHGRLVQIAVLCAFTGARMKPEPRARAEATARQLKDLLAARSSHTAKDFEEIAKDPVWVDRKVSFSTVWQGEDQPFPAVVGRAVRALAKPGDMTDVLGDETGFYLAVYVAEKPPANVPFAEAASELRQEMYEPWRRQRFLQLSLAMAKGHDIEVFPENFSLLAEQTPLTAR
jgi:hypothetical protein